MANLIYANSVSTRLKNIKAGMTQPDNVNIWKAPNDTPASVQNHIDEIENEDAALDALEKQIKQRRQNLKAICEKKEQIANQLELKVKAQHASNSAKWTDYGIADPNMPKAGRAVTQVPAKTNITLLEDDFDGIGFRVEWKSIDDCNTYEIERGVAADATDINTIPAFNHLVTTKKARYTDDDVEQGKRYFYRVRGVNTRGAGEWSEPVSRVQ